MKAVNKDIYTCRNVRKMFLSLSFFLFLFFLTSCSYLRPTKPPIEPITSPEEVLRRVEIKENKIHSLKGIAKLKFTDAKKNYPTVNEVIIAQRPLSLRMETLGFLNKPFFLLTAKENQMSLLSTKENTFYQGTVTPKILSKVFPVSLKLKDLFAILLGSVPFIDYVSTDMRFDQKKKIYLLELMGREEKTEQYLWIDPWNFFPLKSEIYKSQENLVMEVTFGHYKKILPSGS